jgi:hypothetical protein
VPAVVERVPVLEAVREPVDPVRPAGDVAEGRRAHDQSDDLTDRDGDDREIVGSESQRRQTQQDPEHHAGEQSDDDPDPERCADRGGGDSHAVGTGGHEGHLTEVEQAGVAEVQIQADRRKSEDDRLL